MQIRDEKLCYQVASDWFEITQNANSNCDALLDKL